MKRHYTNLIFHRAYIELKTEAVQNYIGVLWWVLEPLMYMCAFYIVFEIFLERGGPGFVGFLLCGLVFFRWFDGTTKNAGNSIMNNGALIRQIYLPKLIFPLTAVVSGTMRFCFILSLLLVFLCFYTEGPQLIWLSLPALLIVQFTMIAGLGTLFAVFVPIYPDLRKFIDNGMLLMFYMSGVFFDTSKLSEEAQRWLNLNPMAVLIQQYRQVLLHGQTPDWHSLATVFAVAAALLLIGLLLAHAFNRKLPNYVN